MSFFDLTAQFSLPALGLVSGGPVPGPRTRRVDRRQPGVHPHQTAASDCHCHHRLCAQPFAAAHHLSHDARCRAERSRAGRLAEVKTMAGVIRATGLAIIGLIAALQALDAMGFNLAPLLASAGVAGIAIGLAAQNIVKDMFNGILILVEGQFSVGDTVRLAGVSGTVEAMTLRKTTVRDADGTLYVIPNSQITTVANLSAGFSVATINVSVDFSANPDEVTKLLKEIAMDVRNSEEFKEVFLEDPQVLGVDAVKGSQMIFPVIFKTLATQQYGPMREFQRRVRLALEEKHLLPGDPNRVFNSFCRRPPKIAKPKLAAQPWPAGPIRSRKPRKRTIQPRSSRTTQTHSRRIGRANHSVIPAPPTQHEHGVPHPSSVWVGSHEPQRTGLVSGRSARTRGCPIQAPLGWDRTNLNEQALYQGAPHERRVPHLRAPF